MAAVGRKLRLLRGHGLIAKVSKTHRYSSRKGRADHHGSVSSRQASTDKLTASGCLKNFAQTEKTLNIATHAFSQTALEKKFACRRTAGFDNLGT